MFKNTFLLLIGLILIPGDAYAGENIVNLVEEYFENLNKGDWAKAATYFHRDDIQPVKNASESLFAYLDVDPEKIKAFTPEESFAHLVKYYFNDQMKLMHSNKLFDDVTIIGAIQESPEIVHVVFRQKFKLQDRETSGVDILTVTKRNDVWKIGLPDQFSSMLEAAKSIAKRKLEKRERERRIKYSHIIAPVPECMFDGVEVDSVSSCQSHRNLLEKERKILQKQLSDGKPPSEDTGKQFKAKLKYFLCRSVLKYTGESHEICLKDAEEIR